MVIRNVLIGGRMLGLLIFVGLMAGCSGKYAYRDTLAKNVHIETKTDSGSVFSNVAAAVGIYRVDEHCKIEYQGTVDLDEPTVSVGIPSGKPTYLVFEFASTAFLASSRRSVSYETLLVPAAGRDYAIKVSYLDDLYNVRIDESQPGNAAPRRVPRRDLRACSRA